MIYLIEKLLEEWIIIRLDMLPHYIKKSRPSDIPKTPIAVRK